MKEHKILLVEDNEAFAASLKTALEMEGHRVECVQSADQGLIRAREGSFDVVVTDLQLPGRVGLELMGGLRLVTELHRLAPRLPIILMTAHHTSAAAIEATKLGAFDYVIKPFDPDELLNVLNLLVSESLPESERAELGEAGEEKHGLIGRSRPMRELYRQIAHLAAGPLPVLIEGEPGAGKQLVARTLHQHSGRADRPFVAVNCAGVSEASLLSKLFGISEVSLLSQLLGDRQPATAPKPRLQRSASFFSWLLGKLPDTPEDVEIRRSSVSDIPWRGILKDADGGTIFLDEVSGLPPNLLLALARFIFRDFGEPGSPESLLFWDPELNPPAKAGTPNVRVLMGTCSDPRFLWNELREVAEVREVKKLRRAVGVNRIRVPPLRERLDDLPALAAHVLKKHGAELGLPGVSIGVGAIEELQAHTWPGNVTELEQVTKRSLLLSRGFAITRETVTGALADLRAPDASLPFSDVSNETQTAVAPLRGQPVIPAHTVHRFIGDGGFGEVWLAEHILLGCYRAVKTIPFEKSGETIHYDYELKAIRSYYPLSQKHEGLLPVFEVGQDEQRGYLYYVMELADDEERGREVSVKDYRQRTLAGDVKRRGKLPLHEAIALGVELAAALEFLHVQKPPRVHRDIKPDNIVYIGGKPKLGDPGLMTSLDRSHISKPGTDKFRDYKTHGTPLGDIFSLGKTLEVSVCEASQKLSSESSGGLPPVSETPAKQVDPMLREAFEQIVRKACAPEKDRYQSAEELREALKALQDRLGRS